jgi:hypothetical protein
MSAKAFVIQVIQVDLVLNLVSVQVCFVDSNGFRTLSPVDVPYNFSVDTSGEIQDNIIDAVVAAGPSIGPGYALTSHDVILYVLGEGLA